MDVLVLRLQAPLMAFGGALIDRHGPTRDMPGRAQMTGLFANALGWNRLEFDRLQSLQNRLCLASLLLRPGRPLSDLQMVDFNPSSSPWMVHTGWTTTGRREDRSEALAERDRYLRLRHYRADSIVLVAVALRDEEVFPTVETLANALEFPVRPLFIGRKPCIPSGPIYAGRFTVRLLAEALCATIDREYERNIENHQRDGIIGSFEVEIDEAEELPEGFEETGAPPETIVDGRDWRNQIHGYARLVRRARYTPIWSEGTS